MNAHPYQQKAYLLRIWPAATHGRTVWRASLQDIQGGETHGFATLQQMTDYLEAQTQTPPEDPESAPPDGEQKPARA